jgi:hypothetical protein
VEEVEYVNIIDKGQPAKNAEEVEYVNISE